MSAADFYTELFYGAGAWLGLLLLLSFIILLCAKEKFMGVLMMPVCIYLGISYLAYPALMWNAMIMFAASIFIVINMAKRD